MSFIRIHFDADIEINFEQGILFDNLKNKIKNTHEVRDLLNDRILKTVKKKKS